MSMWYNLAMVAKIKERQNIAKDTMLVDLALPQAVEFEPGQYLKLTVPNLLYPDPRGRSRYFCLVNSPSEGKILRIAMRHRGSGFKKTLRDLPVGSEVQVEGFWGDLLLPQDTKQPLVFIAGGIGITPYMSMLQFVQEKKLPYKITLLYANPDEASTAFREELQDLASTNPNFGLVLTEARMDAEFIKSHVPDHESAVYYVVGPGAMVAAIFEALGSLGVAQANIRSELFSGY